MIQSLISTFKNAVTILPYAKSLSLEQRNTHSLLKLQPILSALKKVYPYSSSALDPTSLNLVVNDIIINNRKVIVELGSGISTIVIAKLLEINEIETQFYSIDSDQNWASFIQNCLLSEGLHERCKLTYIPTTAESSHWYDEGLISDFKTQFSKIDSLIIDGPIAYMRDRQFSRFGALKNFRELLSENRSVFLHDAGRTGEREVLKRWKDLYDFEFHTFGKMAVHLHGVYFNIE